MGRITPFLWFEDQAEQAAEFYVSLFPNSRITGRYGDAGRDQPGRPLTISFELDGAAFTALNGGPYYKLNGAFSMSVDCADQAEVDRLWDALLADGGQAIQCGWLTDRFGLTWQIVPSALPRLLADPDRAKAQRVMDAMMPMIKLDVAGLEAAAADA